MKEDKKSQDQSCLCLKEHLCIDLEGTAIMPGLFLKRDAEFTCADDSSSPATFLGHFRLSEGYIYSKPHLSTCFHIYIYIYIYIYQISSSTIKHSTSIKTQDQIKTHLLSFNLFCFVFLFNLKLKLSH
jgi:beta-glucanase (GH16 family)